MGINHTISTSLLTAAVALTTVSCSPRSAPTTVPLVEHSSATIMDGGGGTVPGRSGPRMDQLNPALIDAAWENDVDRAAELIAAGADVNFKDGTAQSPYLIATSEGYRELLELTLEHGADVASLDSYNGTGLIRSAERGHAQVVGRLIRAGVDVDHINRLGWTALHESIILGDGSQRYVDTVRVLVAGGADAELASVSDGAMPLDHAAVRDQSRIVQTLTVILDAGPFENPDVALLNAAASGDADDVAVALRFGADVETRDPQRRTPLLLASSADHLDVARLLVALGADPNALDERHDTPWLVTGVTGSVAMANVLLSAIPGPDLTVVNRFGGTSLIPAAERGHIDYVRRIARTSVDVNHINDLGWTALLEAVILGDGSAGYVEIVTILLDNGADPSISDRDGLTPAEHARNRGHDDVAAVLTGGISGSGQSGALPSAETTKAEP